MNKIEEINKYFLELAKKELPMLKFQILENGLICNDFIIDEFKLHVKHSIKLNIRSTYDLSLSDVKRILIGRLNLQQDRVFHNKSEINIYPPENTTMSAPKYALWQVDIIQKLAIILTELKRV